MLPKTSLPEVRRRKLRKLLKFGKSRPGRAIRLIEVHNGLSAIVASNATFSDKKTVLKSLIVYGLVVYVRAHLEACQMLNSKEWTLAFN